MDAYSSGSLTKWTNRIGSGRAKILDFWVEGTEVGTGTFQLESDLIFRFDVEFYEPIAKPSFGILIHDSLGDVLLDLRSSNYVCFGDAVAGKRRITALAPRSALLPGHYMISIWVNNDRETEDVDYVKFCGSFEIVDNLAAARKGRLDRSGAKFWAPSEWSMS